MKLTILIPVFIVLGFLLLVDAYTFRGVVHALERFPLRWLRLIKWSYWLVPVGIGLWLTYLLATGDPRDPKGFPRMMYLIGVITLFYYPKLVFATFLLLDDLWFVAKWVYSKLSGPQFPAEAVAASRSRFLLQVGLVVSALPFAGVISGIWKGRFRFRVVQQPLVFEHLPKAFHGFRLLQISDAHLGSFIGNEAKIEAAVDLINEQKADLIVFTGDIVNNLATELDTFTDVFARLSAPLGKYAVLGNHDYGTHFRWSSDSERRQNLELLFAQHRKMGFELLNNRHVLLQREGQQIALVGVENWGNPPFPQFGDLAAALKGAEQAPFQVLLSHDPSHWDEVVRPQSNVDLTLSGHTHGMQFGIKIGDWQWSPVSLRYPRWGGLYQEGRHFLYVNRGFGVIGFPGRMGMDPEITVFELRNS